MNALRLGLVAFAVSQTLIAAVPVRAGNDFPTLDRVVFVENCVRDHPDRPRQEMIYKCSCALDALAGQLSYEEFVDGSTAIDAGQIAGERGNAIRESNQGQNMSKKYKAARSKAFSSCFIQ